MLVTWTHEVWEAAVVTQHVVAREALARIMRMFHFDNTWKNRLPDVRKTLRARHLRIHVVSFFEFVERRGLPARRVPRAATLAA